MILSHKYRFIFLKTHKTASTSTEIALSRYCGPADVLTLMGPNDELIRAGLGLAPRNYGFTLADYSVADWWALLRRRQKKAGLKYYNHMLASEIKQRVGARVWRTYFKFCFERNPWDKVISQYWHMDQGKADFDDFVRTAELNSDFDLYSLDGQPAMDYIGRYETLAADLARVCEHLGIPFDGWLPRAKGNFRKDRRSYVACYDSVQADIVARRFAREIEYFGYRFGEARTASQARRAA